MAIAASNAGALGSLPCAMLSNDAIRTEVAAIRAGTTKPYNLNFFCHQPPVPSAEREATWRAALGPYYAEFGIDPAGIAAGPGRNPFSAEIAELLAEFRPPVVSFHFGLPSAELLARVKGWGAKVLASATTVNNQHALGVDLQGNPGQDVFIPPAAALGKNNPATGGTARALNSASLSLPLWRSSRWVTSRSSSRWSKRTGSAPTCRRSNKDGATSRRWSRASSRPNAGSPKPW
eukprot:gene33005-37281_t